MACIAVNKFRGTGSSTELREEAVKRANSLTQKVRNYLDENPGRTISLNSVKEIVEEEEINLSIPSWLEKHFDEKRLEKWGHL